MQGHSAPPTLVSSTINNAAAAAKSCQSCLTVRPHRRQPTRLLRPWDSPGKNTGVGCHFLLQCMKVKSESEVAQSGPTLHDPMDCSPPGSAVHGISQARVLEWVPLLPPMWSTTQYMYIWLPWWLSGTESACQCRRCRFYPWIGKNP